MAPAYGNVREAPMNLPALTSCLDCHVSGIQPPIQGTENRYKMPVFAVLRRHLRALPRAGCGARKRRRHRQSCEARPPIGVMPSACSVTWRAMLRLSGRASTCIEFRPGDDLSDYVRYYVRADEGQPGLRAASQFEALAQSMCKKKSGAAMSCMSCHDPHRLRAGRRASFVLSREVPGLPRWLEHEASCQSAGLHFVSHACQLEHRRCAYGGDGPSNPAPPEHRRGVGGRAGTTVSTLPKLVPFPDSPQTEHDDRDMALAWANHGRERRCRGVEAGGTTAYARRCRSRRKTRRCCRRSATWSRGAARSAMPASCISARLAQDPNLLDAATNLGVIEAKSGHLGEAVHLWEGAFERAPGRSSVGMNIARAFCSAGQLDRARDVTMRVLQFNPDLGSAKKMLNGLNGTPAKCGM